MPDNFALYTQRYGALPSERMQQLVDRVTPEMTTAGQSVSYIYRWPDLIVRVNVMPTHELAQHLQGFAGYVQQAIYQGQVPERGEQIIRAILRTRLVVGVVVEPDRDDQGRVQELIGRMCGGLHPIMFYGNALYDWIGRLLLAPNGSYDQDAEFDADPGSLSAVYATVPERDLEGVARTSYDSPEPTPAQLARRERNIAAVRQMSLPVLEDLSVIEDDQQVVLRTAQEVAQRCIVLTICGVKGESMDHDLVRDLIRRYNAQSYFS